MVRIDIPANEIIKLQLGKLIVYIKQEQDEIQYAHEYGEDKKDKITYTFHKRLRNIEDMEWTRCLIGEEYSQLEFAPKMPDKPVVVRPKLAIQVPEGKSTTFFVGIYVWLQIFGVSKNSKIKICEFSTVKLSKTWFGDNESGEICYSLKTQAIRDKDNTTPTFFHAACPVFVYNNSEVMLDFQRICLHAEYLSLYSDEKRLWSNGVNVYFRGVDQISQINISNTAPAEAVNCIKVADPRMTAMSNIVKRSFYFLKYLTGLTYVG